MKKVYIETLGCQMNKSDAERMYGMLECLDYTQTENPKEADLLIINTCSIRQLSEDKAYSAIGVWGKWKKESKPDLKIVFAGCVAQQAGENVLKRAPYVDLVLGTQRLYELPELIKKSLELALKVQNFDLQEGKYKINKEVFKLYWYLETIYVFAASVNTADLKNLLNSTKSINEYTIREKTAKILSKNFNDKDLDNIRQLLKNDTNYYVRRF